MAQLEDLGEVFTTDVLIIGGGLAGLSAAIRAKEQSVDVLVVDKANIGWAGQSTKAGNGHWLLGPNDDIETFVEFHTRRLGDYLNDQDLLRSFASESYKAVEQLVEWGVSITKDEKGNIGTFRHPIGPWSLTGIELDAMAQIRKQVVKKGIKLVDKVQITDLLTDNGRVVGAIGFNLIDLRFYVFKAKSIILANGGCSYGLMGMFIGEGEGIAAAYRAGAEMRNVEICCSGAWLIAGGHMSHGGEYLVYNALGENLARKYGHTSTDVSVKLILGFEKEIAEGRGPLYLDTTQTDELQKVVGAHDAMLNGMVRLFPKKLTWNKRLADKAFQYGPPWTDKMGIMLFSGVSNGPVKTDHDMKTTVPGLWAAGNINWQASAWHGAHCGPGGMRGSGLGHALLSGLRAGISAGSSAVETTQGNIDAGEIKQLKENAFAPLKRDKGVQPAEVFGAIAGVIAPLDQTVRRHKDRMEEAIKKVEGVRRRLPDLVAKDGHGLSKCIESQGIVLNAEMMHRAALMRTESRGTFYREDYPARDDKNWLKWVIVKEQNVKMMVSTEPVPIESYKYRP